MKQLPESPLMNMVLSQHDADLLYEQYPDTPHSPDDGCPTCGKNRGRGKNGTVVLGGEEWECNCADQLQRHKHYLAAGIGLRYQRLSWADWVNNDFDVSRLEFYRNNIDGFIREGIGLIAIGKPGTGKTMLVTLIMKELVQKGYRCYMTTAAQLITMVRDGWKSERERLMFKDKIERADVLFIDDPGKELFGSSLESFNNSHARSTIESILRERVQGSKPTFFATNLGQDEITSQYSESFSSMLKEAVYFVAVNGSDHRPSTQDAIGDRILAGEKRAIY